MVGERPRKEGLLEAREKASGDDPGGWRCGIDDQERLKALTAKSDNLLRRTCCGLQGPGRRHLMSHRRAVRPLREGGFVLRPPSGVR